MADATEEKLLAKLSGVGFVHSVLLVVEKIKPSDLGQQRAWQDFLQEARSIEQKHTSVDVLGESSWPLALQKSLSSFVALQVKVRPFRNPKRITYSDILLLAPSRSRPLRSYASLYVA